MSMTDPIADMITRIRNASVAGLPQVRIPKSKVKREIARILKEEGYIADIAEEGEGVKKVIVLTLKYNIRKGIIRKIQRESKPGGRQYVSADKISQVANGYGTLILSTSKGVMSGFDAKKQGIGGEPLISIF